MLTTPRRITKQRNHDLYHHSTKNVDITEGNLDNDPRVIQFLREIRQLKEKVELQTELNRKLEESNNRLQSELESYKQKASDLQRNLDDKDQHLNEVVASLTQSHQVLYIHHESIPFLSFLLLQYPISSQLTLCKDLSSMYSCTPI